MYKKEITIKRSAEKVWEALTHPEKMKKWYFNISNFEAKEGEIFDFVVSITDEEGVHDFRHLFKIVEVIPNKKLKHTWEYLGYSPGISTLTWELTPEGESTKVLLKHEGLENITDEDSRYFSKASFTAGWNDILKEMKENLEKE